MVDFSEDITFVLFTFNEEKRIKRAILNFIKFGRVLIVDNESADRTREIAVQYGCDVLVNKNSGWVEDEFTTTKVKAAVNSPWIYWGFADEMVESKTIQAIFAVISLNQCDIVNIARKNYYYGQFCSDVLADRMNRIFKKESIDFTGNKIHHFGRAVYGARIHELPSKYFVHHFISNTAKSYLHVMDRYTDIERNEDLPVPSIFRLIFSTGRMIVVNFLFRRRCGTGNPTYFLIVQTVYYRWLSAMKLYENHGNLDRDMIEFKNDIHRDRILRSIQ